MTDEQALEATNKVADPTNIAECLLETAQDGNAADFVTLGHIKKLARAYMAQEARARTLAEALAFYADPSKAKDEYGDPVRIPDFYNELDFGETARAALAEGRGNTQTPEEKAPNLFRDGKPTPVIDD